MTDITGDVFLRPSAPELVDAIGDEISQLFAPVNRGMSLVPMPGIVPRDDAPSVLVVLDAAGHARAVLMCSSPASPDMVHRSTCRARQAVDMLGPDEAWRVLLPVAEGRIRGLSYAVMPHCAPLAKQRPVWWLQRARLKPVLFDWLARLTSTTCTAATADEVDGLFRRPLERLTTLPVLGGSTRSAAGAAAGRLERAAHPPSLVLMHGDLWKGNLLVRHAKDCAPPRSWAQRVVVIDWPGSSPRGHALYDVVRLGLSMRLGPAALAREVDRHCALLGCGRDEATTSLLAALGHIALNLEQFPLESFARMADTCWAALERSLTTTSKGQRHAA